MPHTTSAAIILALILHAVGQDCSAQTRPEFPSGGPYTPGGVMSRNMELLSVVPVHPENHDQFETVTITYPTSGGNATKVFVIVATKDEHVSPPVPMLRVIDVTNPRSVDPDGFLEITAKGFDDDNSTVGYAPFNQYQVYQSGGTPGGTTYNGDVFLIAYVPVTKTDTTWHQVVVAGTGPYTYARFLIFNLTKACSLRATGTSRRIEVHDASERDVTYGSVEQNNANIYLGYVTSDLAWKSNRNGIQGIHSLWVDPLSGIMAATPNWPTKRTSTDATTAEIDLFDLSTLTTVFTPLQTTLQVLPRLSSGGGLPFKIDGFGTNRLAMPRDVYIERIGADIDKTVRLTLACATHERAFDDNQTSPPSSYTQIGGVATLLVHYTTPTALTSSQQNEWEYDNDRERPLGRNSPDQEWDYGMCHTATPFYPVGGGVYMLTADEIAGTHFNPFVRFDGSLPAYVEINGTTYKNARWPLQVYKTSGVQYQNDKRIGAFTRIWNAAENSTTKALTVSGGGSTATTDGAFTQYDPRESLGRPNDLFYDTRRTNNNASSTPSSISAYGSTSTNKIGPGTTHRPVTVRNTDAAYTANDDDVFIASYTQGVHVVNLKNITATNRPVLEKAFFDFIPTLSYNPYDPYFYLLAHRYRSEYTDFLGGEETWAMYYQGVMHCVPDFGPSRVGTNGTGTLPSDEKFICASAFGEGYFANAVAVPDINGDYSGTTIPADPQEVIDAHGRNWLPHGGYLLLRYFDNELGGTLSGYSGTGTQKWAERPYRTINLQGDFNLTRDVTIAEGATVQLIPAHVSDPGIRDVMRLYSNTGKKIIVEGTLNISLPESEDDDAGERALRADITIDVPIEIKNGGVVNVYSIKTGKKVFFRKAVACSLGGTWKFHPGATAELYHQHHTCHGKFISQGTEEKRVTIQGRPAAGSNPDLEATITGAPTYTGSPSSGSQLSSFVVHYTDCKNVFFDMRYFQTTLTTKEVLNSTFLRTTAAATRSAFVHIDNPYVISSNPFERIFNTIVVENSVFSNTYAGSENPAYRGFGVHIQRAPITSVKNSDFVNLHSGCVIGTTWVAIVNDCDFEDNTVALLSGAALGRVCNSNFTDNEFSAASFTQSEMYFHDNIFTGCVDGASSWTGGRQFLRTNTFGTYLYGVNAKNTVLYLRDYIVGGNEYEFGRNNFLSPNPTFQFAGWNAARDVSDIVRGWFSTLFVDCGYNDFLANSTFHVYGNVAQGAFDASNNRWAYGGGIFAPRTNLGYTGNNFNTQEDPDEYCGLLEIESPCAEPTICGGLMNYIDLTAPSSGLYSSIASLNTDITNTALSVDCRKVKTWELVAAVSRADSVPVLTFSKSTLATVATNTGVPAVLRSTAYLAKAKIHEYLGELDSAQIQYSTVMSTFPSIVDSVSANWCNLQVAALRDTLGKQDSLSMVFVERAIYDMRRTVANGGMSKSGLWQHPSVVHTNQISIVAISPNPVSAECSITLSSASSGAASMAIIATTGSIVREHTIFVNAGVSTVVEDMSQLQTGVYLLAVTYDGVTATYTIAVYEQ